MTPQDLIYIDQKNFLVAHLQSTYNQAIYISDSDIKPFFITFYIRFDAYLESVSSIWPDDSLEACFFASLRVNLQKYKLNSFIHSESSSMFIEVIETLLQDL